MKNKRIKWEKNDTSKKKKNRLWELLRHILQLSRSVDFYPSRHRRKQYWQYGQFNQTKLKLHVAGH